MDRAHGSISSLPRNLPLIALALLLGTSFGVYINGYWLTDYFPAESRQALLITLLISLLAAAGHFWLLDWMWRSLAGWSALQRAGLFILGPSLAAFLFLGGTWGWLAADRYITFLLPRHHIRLSAMSALQPGSLALTWFSTSLGDVSYDTVDSHGWTRRGDQLVLERIPSNALNWAGPTGDAVRIVFRGGQPGGTVSFTWDGHEESLTLSEGTTNYVHEFGVPFYASSTFIILLGMLNFAVLCVSLLLLLHQKREAWLPRLTDSISRPVLAFDILDVALLGGVLCLALLLRVFNLSNVFPAVDEYYHLIAAQQIIQGAPLGSVYPRGLWLVTLPVSLALRLFGHEVWAARLVGVVFNVLAAVPLYLIARTINRPIAVVSTVLFAVSPWIITFGRVAREYAYYPFYFYWIIYAMIWFVQAIPTGLVLRRDWHVLVRPRLLLVGAALAFPPFFALTIDWLSTFRTILIAYLVFGLFVLARFDWGERSNWPILGLLAVGIIMAGRAWYLEQSPKMLLLPRLNPLPLSYFLPNPQQQWYFNRFVLLVALGIAAAAAFSLWARRANFVPLFMLVLFVSYLAVFTSISRTFFHTRHLLTTQLWYVGVVAVGLYALWSVVGGLLPWKGNITGVLLAMVLGIAVSNFQQILLPSVSSNPDMPISEDFMHDMSQVQAYMIDHVQKGDVLISTVYGLYATWEGHPEFRDQYRINSQTPRGQIFDIVEQDPSGWIVMDKIRLDLSTVSPKDFTANGQIEYIGIFGDEYVWRWRRSTSRPVLPAPAERE